MADPLNYLSVCSGVGMLDIGFAAAVEHLGYAPRCVGFVEREAYAAATLLARMEEASLEPAPVWCGDLADLDARPLRGWADAVVAGLPCPAFSVAGKQEGLADERAWGNERSPIPQFLRIVGECRPALVCVENVPPFVRGGFFLRFGEELCRMGYEIAQPVFLSAAAVGASHRRERVFIVAYCEGGRLRELRQSSRRDGQPDGCGGPLADASRLPGGQRAGRERVLDSGSDVAIAGSESGSPEPQQQSGERPGIAGGSGVDVADTADAQRGREDAGSGPGRRDASGRASGDVGDTDLARAEPRPENSGPRGAVSESGERVESGLPGDRPGVGAAVPQGPDRQSRADGVGNAPGTGLEAGREGLSLRADEFPLFAPGPSDPRWPALLREAPWLAPAVEPGVCVPLDECPLVVDESRADQLRCSGNGCVPLQAAVAFVEMLRPVLRGNHA